MLLLLDALSFAYAGVTTFLITPDRPLSRATTGAGQRVKQYLADTRVGVVYVWRQRGMSVVLGIFAGVNCLFMPVFVLLPFYTREVLHRGPEWYGFVMSGAGVGALAGSLAAWMISRTMTDRARVARMCLSGVSAGVLTLAATKSAWVALAAFVAIGAMSSVVNVMVLTAFQSAISADVRGRVMALVIASSTAAVPVGMALGGAVGEFWRTSLPVVFACSGAALACLALLSWIAGSFSRVFERV